MGFQDGLSLQVFGIASDFAQGFPLQARVRIARTSVEPGSARDARRIFINDATNGTPTEAGKTWDLGIDGLYPMGTKMSLILSGGGEYFFSSRLTGHDTSYTPDGDDVNPRRDYTYSDADAAVDQPVWRPLALVEFSYKLGG